MGKILCFPFPGSGTHDTIEMKPTPDLACFSDESINSVIGLQPMDLDNSMHDAGMTEGESEMPKRIKERVQIGTDANGKPVYVWVDGYSKQELFEKIAAVLHSHGRIAEAPIKKSTQAFEKYACSWLTLYKQGNIRHTTLSEYTSILSRHLIPEFGALDISEITTDRVQAMLNSKKDYSKKTLHEIIMVLSMIMDSALEDGYITRNPARSKRLMNPSTKKHERAALTSEQAQDIIENLTRLSQARDRRFLALLLFTGMRREEVLGLKWNDIDIKAGQIHVQRAITFKGNRPVVGMTKTEKGMRVIPLHDELRRWLIKDDDSKEYVVQDGITQQIVKRMWKRISTEINVYGATPHCFRHTFTTLCRRSGMDEKTLQTIGGWSDIETMRRVYTHTQGEDIQAAGAIMNNMFKPTSTAPVQ